MAQGTDVTTKSGFELTRPSGVLNVGIPHAVSVRDRVDCVRATHPEIRKRSGKAWAILKKNSSRHAPPTIPNVIGLFIRDTCHLALLFSAVRVRATQSRLRLPRLHLLPFRPHFPDKVLAHVPGSIAAPPQPQCAQAP